MGLELPLVHSILIVTNRNLVQTVRLELFYVTATEAEHARHSVYISVGGEGSTPEFDRISDVSRRWRIAKSQALHTFWPNRRHGKKTLPTKSQWTCAIRGSILEPVALYGVTTFRSYVNEKGLGISSKVRVKTLELMGASDGVDTEFDQIPIKEYNNYQYKGYGNQPTTKKTGGRRKSLMTSQSAVRAVSAVSNKKGKEPAVLKGKEPAVLKGRLTRSAAKKGQDGTDSPIKKNVGQSSKKVLEAEVLTVTEKRGHGRPRKDEKSAEEPIVKRGRGRPKKVVDEDEESRIAQYVNEAILEVDATGVDHDHESDVAEEDDGQESGETE
ncbi:MAG: hypothetical protein J3Q66DRAFT_446177 [Benniella sp.]|nr:MAG: hypothetical protein J3Q66DRAFT_446177 [Benniella sp.]